MAAVAFAAAQASENENQPPQHIIDMLGLVQDDNGNWAPSHDGRGLARGPGGRRLAARGPGGRRLADEKYEPLANDQDEEDGPDGRQLFGGAGRRLARGPGGRRLDDEEEPEENRPPQHIIDMLGLEQDENGDWFPGMGRGRGLQGQYRRNRT